MRPAAVVAGRPGPLALAPGGGWEVRVADRFCHGLAPGEDAEAEAARWRGWLASAVAARDAEWLALAALEGETPCPVGEERLAEIRHHYETGTFHAAGRRTTAHACADLLALIDHLREQERKLRAEVAMMRRDNGYEEGWQAGYEAGKKAGAEWGV